MSETKRRLEQKIIDYLDAKAKNSKVTELRVSKAYASVDELAKKLFSPPQEITILLEDLLSQNRAKLFPSSKGAKKLYGSIILPAVSEDASPTDTKRSLHRIYGREITAMLLVPIKYS